MTNEERLALGKTRRLAFQNIANGVLPEQVGPALRLSPLELDNAVRFVSRKIAEYLALRRLPPIESETVAKIRWNRRDLLTVLAKIGDMDLSTDLILRKVLVQAFDHPEMIEGAKRRMAEAKYG